MSAVGAFLSALTGCIAWVVLFYSSYLVIPSKQLDLLAQLSIHLGGCGFIALILALLNAAPTLAWKSKWRWEYVWQLDLAGIGLVLVLTSQEPDLKVLGVIFVPLVRFATWLPLFIWRTIDGIRNPPGYTGF